jgi:Tol biopolymer transport system component
VSVRRSRAVAALLAAPLLACQSGGVPQVELPADPIAFNYRTPEEARRRADAWEDAREDQQKAARGGADVPVLPTGEMHSSTDQLGEFFGRVLGRAGKVEDVSPGRLALLDPRTGRVLVLEAARRGSVPLDWSPDHKRLLFAQPGDRDFQIYEYDRDLGTVRPITHAPTAHAQACYASEGRILVVAFDAQSDPQRTRIELSRPGGGGPFTALTEWGFEHSPTCAPDGRSAVWVRENSDGRFELRLRVLADGTETLTLAPGRQPRFSPDGAWIVYSAPVHKDWRIWRVRPDGSGRAPIGSGQRSEMRPTLSPDGRFVLYVASEAPPRRHLYLRRFDGSGDRILFADGDGENPVW